MTREERIQIIKHLKYDRSIGAYYMITDKDADEIIKALEQEPCEDAISREAVLKLFATHDGKYLYEAIRELPPVQPELKTGWVPVSERLPEEYGEYLITWTTSTSKKPFISICECEETLVYDHEHNRFKVEWLLDDYIKGYPDIEVVAYMPLPEPYKAESEE